ncbi:MAG: FAD binding domain-containing protein [Chloroflexi bacterium]|nr:FAD binding domain-containing protein [Chloroflexota bacterium]
MNPFDFQSPSTVGEAAALLTQQARPIAGGTDLLAEIKNGVVAPDLLVNLLNIAELQGITELADGLRIGATTRIEDLLEWPGLWQNYSLLAQSCQVLAWSEIRAMGTVGGNLCQRPRCWYYRHPLGTRCLKRGGDHCYPTQGRANGPFAIFGGGPCYAVHPSDLAVALAAMDATLTIEGVSGRRAIRLDDFFSPHDVARENTLQAGELLVGVDVPRPQFGARAVYLKSKQRASHDFARASVALAARADDNRLHDARLVLGGVAAMPWRQTEVEQMLNGQTVSAELAAQAATLAVRDARPLVSTRGTSNTAKVALTAALVRRAVLRMADSK